MSSHPQPDALLAYIEDELDPDARRAIEQHLRDDPQLSAAVADMRQDRAALRSMPEPELPEDLVESLEPLLARPMLMEPPGAARRQQARSRWPAAAGLAAAAAVMIGTGVGLWTTGLVDADRVDQIIAWAATDRDHQSTTSNGDAAASPDGADRASSPAWIDRLAADQTGPVHHLGPDLPRLAPNDERASDNADDAARDQPGFRNADVVLVISTDDRARAVDELLRAAEALSGPVALVENFSYEEAERIGIAALARAARDNARSAPGDHRAGTRPRSGRDRDRWPRNRDEWAKFDIDPGDLSRKLHGVDEFAPDLQQQLIFAEYGATLTISVPAGRLSEVLAAVDRPAALRTWLRPAEVDAGSMKDVSDAPADHWLAGGRRLRAMIRDLPADAIIHLPVAVVTTNPTPDR